MQGNLYKILIIEDDPEIVETLSELLKLEGFEAFTANEGRTGIGLAMKYLPDLIICDIMMPEMDGFEVLKTLRQNPDTFSIPFLFLTAKTEKFDRRHGMGLGADDYISKPYEEEDLLKAIESRLNKTIKIKKFYDKKLETLHNYIAATLPNELRVPLNTIIGFTSLLKNKHKQLTEGELNTIHDNIMGSGQRLLKLITNYTYYSTLIDLSISEDNYPGTSVDHSQTIIYSQAIEISEEYDRVNDLSIDMEDTAIQVTDSHLAKVSRELTDNALKFSEPGTEVILKSFVEDGHLVVSVSNKGIGMTQEEIDGIAPFIKFLPKEFSKNSSGLGLSIVKKIAEIHQGSFDIKSVPGESITATIKLPLVRKEPVRP